MMNKEEWKAIKGYENIYEVSSLGNVRSLDRKILQKNNGVLKEFNYKGKKLKKVINTNGYYVVHLSKNQKNKHVNIHRIVAETFIPNPNKYRVVNHKDENKLNNCVDNLEWCTYLYNTRYGTGIERRIKSAIKNNKLGVPINQYDLDGKFIKKFPSSKEIQRQYGFNHSNITKCCRGVYKTMYGYIWRYCND